MTDAAVVVKRINRELARALREQMRRLPELETAEGMARAILGLPSLGIAATSSGEASSFARRVTEAHNEIAAFLANCSGEYCDGIRRLPGRLVKAGDAGEALRLASYFDTALVELDSSSDRPDDPGRMLLTPAASSLYNWNRLIPALECDADTPIVAAWPISLPPSGEAATLREGLITGRFSSPYMAQAARDWTAVLGRLGLAAPIVTTLDRLHALPAESLVNLSDVLDVNALRAIFPAGVLGLFAGSDSAAFAELQNLVNGKTSTVSGQSLRHVFASLFGTLYRFSHDEELAACLRAHPVIHAPELYRWHLEIQGEWTRAGLELNPDYVAAQSIRLPEFSWVDVKDAASLARFREVGGLSLMRGVLREELDTLARSPIDNFHFVADAVGRRLAEAVEEHERDLRVTGSKSRREIIEVGVGFGLTVALALMSAPIPPPAFVLVATGVSLALGFSATDLFAALSSQGARHIELRNRPVAILADLLRPRG